MSATGAFFGIGAYLVGTGMSDLKQSYWLMTAIAPVVGAVVAALIGFATLRLSGVYFVIFTLGLAEMLRNLVSWFQNNIVGSRGLYVLTDLRDHHLFWMLLAISALAYLLGWLFVATVMAYYFVYEILHFCHHLPTSGWMGALPLLPRLRRHHALHHDPRLMLQND